MLFLLTILVGAIAALSLPRLGRPFEEALKYKRADSLTGTQVDLGYAVYEGVQNTTSNITSFLGIRFAAAPISELRWQPPQSPAINRSAVIMAIAYGSQCPQSPPAIPTGMAKGTVASEDCLFLNVYSPINATNLPVLVWIHGGGYGAGNGQENLWAIISANDNGFAGLSIQYRLGAFGFLSSDEVFRNGVVNAGILDQTFALQWVQDYIGLFGGNSSQVTISGESAGGGSVMLQSMAYGGSLGDSIFSNVSNLSFKHSLIRFQNNVTSKVIAASPYLPQQYGYKDWVPSQTYYAFATAAGCAPKLPYGNSSQPIFKCLVSQDTSVLQNASFVISSSGTYGTWGFLPVTDGVFIQDLPSQQLLRRAVNGKNLLIGNDVNEGAPFVQQNITTEDELVSWLQLQLPLFTNDDISKVLLYYPSSNATDNSMAPKFATSGTGGPTAVTESQIGAGQQQRADDIYAETTFVCPAYWMAEAFSDKGRSSFKYQYSVLLGTHGSDVSGYFGPAAPNQGPDFEKAFMSIWGNFVMKSNTSITSDIANGASSNVTTTNPASTWPPFNIFAPYQINLNETGGVAISTPYTATLNYTQFIGPGLMNDITLVNAYTWEGGRGFRCDFWRTVSAIVPE